MVSAAQRPESTEFAPFYGRYIDLAPEGDIIAQLRESGATRHASRARRRSDPQAVQETPWSNASQ